MYLAVTDIFTAVYVLVDDYLQAVQRLGRFKLPKKRNQKGSYSELMTIVLVGEVLQQKNQPRSVVLDGQSRVSSVVSDAARVEPVLPYPA